MEKKIVPAGDAGTDHLNLVAVGFVALCADLMRTTTGMPKPTVRGV